VKQHDPTHYASIVAVLLAGDVQARMVRNGFAPSVEVKQSGDRVIWGNTGPTWAFTVVTKDGMTAGGETTTASGVPPEQAALLIAKGVEV
jgi:hypothetical protein